MVARFAKDARIQDPSTGKGINNRVPLNPYTCLLSA